MEQIQENMFHPKSFRFLETTIFLGEPTVVQRHIILHPRIICSSHGGNQWLIVPDHKAGYLLGGGVAWGGVP